MRMDDKKFNKWFSVFILAGMTVALLLTTAIKMGSVAKKKEQAGKRLVILVEQRA